MVPAGEAVAYRLVSLDVIHEFWVPELKYKHDLIPGMAQTEILTFARPGRFPGHCGEFCGLYHTRMVFSVDALSPARVHRVAAPRTAGVRRARRGARARGVGTGAAHERRPPALTTLRVPRLGRDARQHRPQAPRAEHDASLSLVFFLGGGVMALLMRVAARPARDMHFVSYDTYDELFTMHGSTMIYLFVTPMAIALAVYLVPLQIGAAGMSAPRVALGGLLGVAGGRDHDAVGLADRGRRRAAPAGSAYVPLSNSSNTPGVGPGPVDARRDPRRGRADASWPAACWRP